MTTQEESSPHSSKTFSEKLRRYAPIYLLTIGVIALTIYSSSIIGENHRLKSDIKTLSTEQAALLGTSRAVLASSDESLYAVQTAIPNCIDLSREYQALRNDYLVQHEQLVTAMSGWQTAQAEESILISKLRTPTPTPKR